MQRWGDTACLLAFLLLCKSAASFDITTCNTVVPPSTAPACYFLLLISKNTITQSHKVQRRFPQNLLWYLPSCSHVTVSAVQPSCMLCLKTLTVPPHSTLELSHRRCGWQECAKHQHRKLAGKQSKDTQMHQPPVFPRM
ncbi:hypothetical protein COO60DRAFT_849089 [Scenedesmus sp. NREL 46B-D3]|nr:hypothetical protein COO60DRAFT_849089 [Scenedesmus sp. NREL 46B-D3]